MSLIIPFYNEEEQIPLTIAACVGVLDNTGRSWEIIAIDDGSTDNSWQLLYSAAEKDNRIRVFRFSRNFGKEAAICAGLDLAAGDAVILIDGDLQHPPASIPEMLDLWDQGYEVVEGKKSARGRESFFSRLNARIFYGSFRRLSGYDLTDASDFKLLDRKVVDAWRDLPEHNTFFRALSLWLGFKRTTFSFDVGNREKGKSKWKISGLFRLSLNAITGFSARPLYLISFFGAFLLLVFFILGIQTLINYFAGNAASGFTTVILLQLLIGGATLISLGLIGIYIGRIFSEAKGRPRYIISDAVNMSGVSSPSISQYSGSIVIANSGVQNNSIRSADESLDKQAKSADESPDKLARSADESSDKQARSADESSDKRARSADESPDKRARSADESSDKRARSADESPDKRARSADESPDKRAKSADEDQNDPEKLFVSNPDKHSESVGP
ncbi:MAG TPA: glycosyltransferase [Clostridiaceae bacterium]|nr:glycosyltransferase [Clostridiaceae bacterium]